MQRDESLLGHRWLAAAGHQRVRPLGASLQAPLPRSC